MTANASLAAEGRATAERFQSMVGAAGRLRASGIIDHGRAIGPTDVCDAVAFLMQAAPITAKNYQLHAHLRLTGAFARIIGERLGLNPYELEVAGNLHDCGRLLTHRYFRNDLLAELFFRKAGIREEIVGLMLPARICLEPFRYRDHRELTPPQRVLAISDFIGKRKEDGTIRTFGEALRSHLASRRSRVDYARYIGQDPLWPSEQRSLEALSPEAAGHWANIYEGIASWLLDNGVNVDEVRQAILESEAAHPIDTVIFDVGGVLTEDRDALLLRDIQHTLSAGESTFASGWATLAPRFQMGMPEEEFWNALCQALVTPVPANCSDLLVRSLSTSLMPGIQRILEELRVRKYRLAILSDTVRPHQRELERAGVYAHFDDVVLSPDIECTKADGTLEAFRIAALRQHRPPQACLFIDDKVEHVRAAQRIGMEAIHFRSVERLTEDLLQRGIL